jgi:DNA-binding beta-propeller fold protein YncE|tara:strand:+ start:4681 stop:5493 length:813 start_codon:yes stop_codon:yes gene_type:complete
LAPIVTNPYRFAAATPVGGWDFANSTYTAGDLLYIGGVEGIAQGISIVDSGAEMYISGSAAPDALYQYTLSTPWDITSATYTASVATPSSATNTTGIYMKEDGLKVYFCDSSANAIYMMTLSTAYDITTATQTDIISSQDSAVTGIFFRDNGLELYEVGYARRVYKRTLSTAWDITTAGTATSFWIGSWTNAPNGVSIKPDGTKLYFIEDQNNRIYELDFGTAWDISTLTFSQYKSANDATPTALWWRPDGTNLYHIGISTDNIYQWAVP